MLGSVAGLVCAVGLLLAGHRGAIVPALLAGGGLLGSVAAWWLAVQLGPGASTPSPPRWETARCWPALS